MIGESNWNDTLRNAGAAGAVFFIIAAIAIECIVVKQNFDKQEQAVQQQEQLEQEIRELAEEMIANGCDVYLDGQKIDVLKYNLEWYEIAIVGEHVVIRE